MRGQVNRYNDYLDCKIAEYMKKSLSKGISGRNEEYYRGLVESPIKVVLQHSSTIPNGIYVMTADLSHLAQTLQNKKLPLSAKDDSYMSKHKMTVLVVSLFGKSSKSDNCINCNSHKYRLINLS